MYEGAHTDVAYSTRVDESSNLSMTCLGRTRLTRETKVKQRRNSQFQDKDIFWENCLMILTATFFGNRCE